MKTKKTKKTKKAAATTEQWFLTIDGKKYDWVSRTIAGSDLRALVPGLNPQFVIIREAEPKDQVVIDSEEIDLSSTPAFYTAPPATFGSAA